MNKQAYFKMMGLQKKAALQPIDTSTFDKQQEFLKSPVRDRLPVQAYRYLQKFKPDEKTLGIYKRILESKLSPNQLQEKAVASLPKELADIDPIRLDKKHFPATALIKYLSSPQAQKAPSSPAELKSTPRTALDRYFARHYTLPQQQAKASEIANKWRNRSSSPWNFIKYMIGWL